MQDVGVDSWPGGPLKEPGDYARACARAEVWVSITEHDRNELLLLSTYRKYESKCGGRVLKEDHPGLGLKKHDR